MALDWHLLGALGGSEVEIIPVEVTATGGKGSTAVIQSVTVPDGETWLVVLTGHLDAYYSSASGPELYIGPDSVGPGLAIGNASIAAEVTGTVEIGIKRNNAYSADGFYGQVYLVPLS